MRIGVSGYKAHGSFRQNPVRMSARFLFTGNLYVCDVLNGFGNLALVFQTAANGRVETFLEQGVVTMPGHPHFPYGILVVSDRP